MSDRNIQIIRDHLKEISFRKDHKKLWDDVLNQCNYVPTVYLNSWIDFQFELLNNGNYLYEDLSVIIKFQGKNIAVAPFILCNEQISLKDGEQRKLLFDSPIFIDGINNKVKIAIVDACIKMIDEICQKNGINTWVSMCPFDEKLGLSYWHQGCLKRGAEEYHFHDFYIDLTISIEDIKSHFRRSYRSLISTDISNEFSINYLCAGDSAIWEEFKNLHIKVSGRQTRSDETWDIQHKAIDQKEGVLIFIRDSLGVMQGAAFFYHSKDEAVYASGVYNREMKKDNLGHLTIFHAVIEFKKSQIRWIRLGEGFLGDKIAALSDKERAINFFKQGFITNILRRQKLVLQLKD